MSPPIQGRVDVRPLVVMVPPMPFRRLGPLETALAILVRVGNVSISDGPFAETKEQASGASSPSR